MKRCFVISPIGPEDSEIRKDANDVFDYIIKPAMDECGFTAVRSDHVEKPGKISEQMFSEIFNADLCIADLTRHNPNVFYEMAVAQSAIRPVIILIRKGEQLPFDVRDLRSIYYDLNIRSYQERTYINKLVAFIKEYETVNWRVQDIFSAYRPNKSTEQEITIIPASADFGTKKEWLNLLQRTEKCFDIMGIENGSWRRTGDFEEVLQMKTKNGCKVRILMMDVENPSLNLTTTNLELMKQSLPNTQQYFIRLAKENTNIEVRLISTGIPYFSLTRNDYYCVVIQYMNTKKWGTGPLMKYTCDSALYKLVLDEFDAFWKSATPTL